MNNSRPYRFNFTIKIVGMNLNTFIFVPSDNTLSPLLLQNVEALSSIENGGWIYCFSAGSVVCPITQEKVYTYRY